MRGVTNGDGGTRKGPVDEARYQARDPGAIALRPRHRHATGSWLAAEQQAAPAYITPVISE
jgi:hypothetical protein